MCEPNATREKGCECAEPRKTVIMGAAGRDFHNYLVYFRGNPWYEVIAFTATQIPDIANKEFPKELSGGKPIPIVPEEKLPELIKKGVELVVLAYSDLSHQTVMEKASLVLSCGADFMLMGPESTMLDSKKPMIAVCAVRTGSGKSPTTRYIARILKSMGKSVGIVRHPMPYGNLKEEVAERLEKYEDLEKYKCTIEEREEYEQHIKEGSVVYAGIDYKKILEMAEKECDIIIFDGGNNDLPFYRPDLHIVLADAHRPGHELSYYPGSVNLRMADVVIISKVNTAPKENVEIIRENIKKKNSRAAILEAELVITMEPETDITGKRVLVIEDGPTLTHGGMKYGAGFLIAKKEGARVIDPHLYAKGTIKEILKKYELENVVPAMGYTKEELLDLERTINASACDFVIDGSPVNLSRLMKINKPIINISYSLNEVGAPKLEKIIKAHVPV